MRHLTEQETALLERIDEKGAVQFLRKLVNSDSQNPLGKERETAEIIREKLEEIGLLTETQEVEKGRFNVIGLLPGEKKEELLWNGHMDTVSIGDPALWTKHPFGGEIEDGKLYGRGSCDMKAGLAAMIFALEALAKSGVRRRRGILFTAVIDEEVNFKGTKALIEAGKLKNCVRACVSEPTSVCPASSLQGAAEFTARFYGKAAHSGCRKTGATRLSPWLLLLRS